jgi:hypothetical protein
VAIPVADEAPVGTALAVAADGHRAADKESRILHRRLAEHNANMTATLAGIKDLAEAQR